MTIYDIISLFTDGGKIEIYSLKKGKPVFIGDCDDIPAKYVDEEVLSIDTFYEYDDSLTFNIR